MEHIDYVSEVEKEHQEKNKKEREIGRKKCFNRAWTMFPPCGVGKQVGCICSLSFKSECVCVW